MNLLAVFIGGGIGAVLRYLLSRLVSEHWNGLFPIGTLVVNLTGCFIIGFLFGIFQKWSISPNLRLFIFLGVLGGYTTFSTFGLETLNLIRSSEVGLAVFNVAVSNIGGLVLALCGFLLSQALCKSIG